MATPFLVITLSEKRQSSLKTTFFMSRELIADLICSGKDITHKLYSLNEHLGGLKTSETERFNEACKKNLSRSLSLDAVHTGRNGNVRSVSYRRNVDRKGGSLYSNSK